MKYYWCQFFGSTLSSQHGNMTVYYGATVDGYVEVEEPPTFEEVDGRSQMAGFSRTVGVRIPAGKSGS